MGVVFAPAEVALVLIQQRVDRVAIALSSTGSRAAARGRCSSGVPNLPRSPETAASFASRYEKVHIRHGNSR
jgi:hypothetical protein